MGSREWHPRELQQRAGKDRVTVLQLRLIGLVLLVAGWNWALAQDASRPLNPETLTLSRALEMQRENNRSIKAALRQTEIASAEVYRVNVRPNPSVTAQVSNTEPNRYRPGSTDRILRLDQLIERGGKRELRTRLAQLNEQAAKWDLADVTRQQRSVLAAAYYDLVAAQDLVDVANENLAGYRRLLEAAERRERAGDLAAVDVARLRVELGRAANEVRSAQGQVSIAQVSLAAVMGQENLAPQLRAADPLPGRADVEAGRAELARGIDEFERLVNQRRADLLAAQLRLDAAEQSVVLSRSLRERDVSVGVQTERSPAFGGTVFGISATVPLFVNNDFAGDIARALAERDAARDDLARTRAAARTDLERVMAQVQAAADRALRLQDTTLADANQVVTAIEFAFARGATTLTDLFDARRQRAAVRAEAITARAEFARAMASFRASLSLESQP